MFYKLISRSLAHEEPRTILQRDSQNKTEIQLNKEM